MLLDLCFHSRRLLWGVVLVTVQVEQGVHETMGEKQGKWACGNTAAQHCRANDDVPTAGVLRGTRLRGKGEDVSRPPSSVVGPIQEGHSPRRCKDERNTRPRRGSLLPLYSGEQSLPGNGRQAPARLPYDVELHLTCSRSNSCCC